MKLRCQDGSIDVKPDYVDDVVSLVVRDFKGCKVTLTLSRRRAQQLSDDVQDAVDQLAEYDDD